MTIKTFCKSSLVAMLLASPAAATDLTISVENIRNEKGNMLIALFDNEKDFAAMDEKNAYASFSLKPDQDGLKITLYDLPTGRYAIGLFHDENTNGALDMNKKGFPFEGFGISNVERIKSQSPKFEEAAFKIGSSSINQTIRVNYLK